MLLVFEIACGVLLGLLAFRAFDSFCKRRNLTMPAGALLIAMVIALILIVSVATPYAYQFVKERKNRRVRVILSNDLPPDPPGYFWVRTHNKPDQDDESDPTLKGGHCERDCDTDHPLWLVPKSNKEE